MTDPLVVIYADDLDQRIEAACARALAKLAPFEPEWLDTAAAAALIGEHPKTTARRARRNEIPGKRLGNQWRFRRSDVIAFIERAPETTRRTRPAAIASVQPSRKEQ